MRKQRSVFLDTNIVLLDIPSTLSRKKSFGFWIVNFMQLVIPATP